MAILSLYISSEEISRADLRALVQKSYQTFRHPDVTPLRKLNDKKYVLELFHGPTFAFKDVALQLLGNLFEFFLLRRNAQKAPGEKQERLTVVGATSGDTGRYDLLAFFLLSLRSFQRCHIWPTEQGQHLDIYPPPQRPRVAYPGSPNDHRHRRQRS